MTVLYLILAFAAGFGLAYFIPARILKLKYELNRAKLEAQLEAAQSGQKSTQALCYTIKEEFVNLANSAILEKQQMLEEQNLKKLDNQLNPLKERLGEFQKKVE